MRRFCLLAAVLLGCGATTVAAQNQTPPPPSPRLIPLPDTLGANFNVADSATAKSSPSDFDFMVGLWEFTFQQRRPDGTFNAPFRGHWWFAKKSSGAFIEDHWRSDSPGDPWDSGTWTYRTFVPARGLWEMQGVATRSGHWQPGLMWSDGADRLLIQWTDADTLIRFRYFAIEDSRFLWRADLSRDRGETWIRDWWTMDVKRISR
jgi:hypothetical protein